MGREKFNVHREVLLGASYRVRAGKVLWTLMRDIDVPHFTKIL